jgi:hypothetical protein
MSCDDYKRRIADELMRRNVRMIQNTPQPTMMGGKRPRQYVLPITTDYDYPDSLAVSGEHSRTLGESFWGDYKGGMSLGKFRKSMVGRTVESVGKRALEREGKKALDKFLSGNGMYNEEEEYEGGALLRGEGIFGKKFDRFVKKTIGKKATKTIYKALDKTVKPLVNKGLDMGITALETAQPELIPALQVGKKVLKGYIDRPSAYQKNPTKELIKDTNPVGLATDYAQSQLESYMTPASGAGRTGRKRNAKKALGKTHYWDGNKWVLLPQMPITGLESDTIIEGGRKRGRPAKVGSYPNSLVGRGRNARAEIVKRVMKEKGLNLPSASKYVKENGLY